MSDPIWYYARGESEQGPISTAQIKALAATGSLHRDDLVWKEGMENWLPASEVDELFSSSKKNGKNSETKEEPTLKSTGATKPRPAIVRPVSTHEVELSQVICSVGRALVVLGVLIVLMSRGCDSLGVRKVARLQALAESAESEFQRSWDRRKRSLEDELQSLRERPDRNNIDQQRLSNMPTEIASLDREKAAEQRDLRRGTWANYQIAAEDATSSNRMWAYWRQLGFLFGTMVLAVGLLFVTPTTEGPERWICLAMLTVILYSVYASDSVWGGSF
jgi:GYF domain 2